MIDYVYYISSGGETSIIFSELMNKEIYGRIYRDGREYRPSGPAFDATKPPAGHEFEFNPNNGEVTFETETNADETIDIPYKLPSV